MGQVTNLMYPWPPGTLFIFSLQCWFTLELFLQKCQKCLGVYKNAEWPPLPLGPQRPTVVRVLLQLQYRPHWLTFLWPVSLSILQVNVELINQAARTSRPVFPWGSVSWCGAARNVSSDFMGNKRIFVQEFPGGTMISAHPQRTGISCYTQRTLISMVWNTHHLKDSNRRHVFVPFLVWILCVLVYVFTCKHGCMYIYISVQVCTVGLLYVSWKETPKLSFTLRTQDMFLHSNAQIH